jgi:hypothetical protein
VREPLEAQGADEALPLLAISAGASLLRTDERIAPASGIGVVLGCPPHRTHRCPVGARLAPVAMG